MAAMQGGGGENSGGGFHLLEVTIISAQDLHLATTSMSTYATAWIDPGHTLCTRIDTAGGTDPTWNDKFVFTVDDAFLLSATSAITVDVWAKRYLRRRDSLLGTARILLSAIDSSATGFAAVMVRRPRSLRPQGILNVGFVLLGPTGANLPANAAIAHKDLISAAAAGSGGAGHLGLPLRSLTPVGSENGSAELRERHKSVEEMKALESKLEQWRAELPPPSTARRRRSMSCFSCCCVKEDDVEDNKIS